MLCTLRFLGQGLFSTINPVGALRCYTEREIADSELQIGRIVRVVARKGSIVEVAGNSTGVINKPHPLLSPYGSPNDYISWIYRTGTGSRVL